MGESADKNFAVILNEKNKEIDRQSNVIKPFNKNCPLFKRRGVF
jgi:hypothetical protein